jgi:hypothetical protein
MPPHIQEVILFVVQNSTSTISELNSFQRFGASRAGMQSVSRASGRMDSSGRSASVRQEYGAEIERIGNPLPPVPIPMSQPRTEPVTVPGPSTPAPPASANEHNGLTRLRATLQALGINTAGLHITYSEDTVGYPCGSYVNRLITVSNGGKTESFSADLTERNPLVTAYEMQRYFGASQHS